MAKQAGLARFMHPIAATVSLSDCTTQYLEHVCACRNQIHGRKQRRRRRRNKKGGENPVNQPNDGSNNNKKEINSSKQRGRLGRSMRRNARCRQLCWRARFWLVRSRTAVARARVVMMPIEGPTRALPSYCAHCPGRPGAVHLTSARSSHWITPEATPNLGAVVARSISHRATRARREHFDTGDRSVWSLVGGDKETRPSQLAFSLMGMSLANPMYCVW